GRSLRCRRGGGFHQSLALGDGHKLLEGLFDLPGGLAVDAVPPALVHVEPGVAGELMRPHQRKEVRLLAGFEELARLRDVMVLASQPLEQLTAADERGTERGGAQTPAAGCFEQNARV